MSDINANNYVGASAVIVGYTSSAARPPAYDKDGSKGILEVSIPINEGYKKDGEFVRTGVTWYTYVAGGTGADLIRDIPKGSKVRIDDAKQEVREYTDREGNPKLGISLRFGSIEILESGNSGSDSSPF